MLFTRILPQGQSRVSFKRLNVVLTVFATVCIAVLSGCSSPAEAEEDTLSTETVIPVNVQTVSLGTFTLPSEFYGKVEPSIMASLSIPAGGRVEALFAREGDAVTAGMSLGRIDAERIEQKYRLAQQAESIARDTWQRQKELYEKGSVSKISADQSRLQWLSAQAQMTDAARLREGALCIAPLDGIVLKRHVELFDETAPGMPSFTVGNVDTLKARIGIPENEIGSIEEGSTARISFASHPGITITGTLVRLSRITSQQSITFEGIIEFPNPDGIILPGITSRIVLDRKSLENVVIVPLESVLNKASGTVVMTEADGIAYEKKVVLGPTDGKAVVIESGLSSGERIIVGGNHVVSAGKPVNPVIQ